MNEENFQTFFYWINERHKIYEHRIQGYPKPWSGDPIFQNWKFCNVFRQLDKQSEWLIKHVINSGYEYLGQELLLFNIFVFRAFNWYPTYDWVAAGFSGKPWLETWDEEKVKGSLKAYLNEFDGQLTSGAYMLRGREGMPKYDSIAMTLTDIWEWKRSLLFDIKKQPTLQNAVEKILGNGFWGWGPFTAYQVALDLTYSPILANPDDLNTWCEFGPGAERGIKLIYPDIKRTEMLEAAKGLLKDSPKHLEKHVPDLNLQDIEFCLCELNKYIRIQNGGKGKELYNGRT